VTSPTNSAPPPAAETGAFVIVADDYPYNPTTPSSGIYALPPNVVPPQPPPLKAPTAPNSYTMGQVNGRIFRLGAAITEDYEIGILYPPGSFDLDPQYGIRGVPTTPGAFPESPDTLPCSYLINTNPVYKNFYAKVYIIGMGKDDPKRTAATNPPATYGKGAQDVGVYSTLVPVQ
jgi:hypothetical protein